MQKIIEIQKVTMLSKAKLTKSVLIASLMLDRMGLMDFNGKII